MTAPRVRTPALHTPALHEPRLVGGVPERSETGRIVIVSNRLPVTARLDGGLVTLEPSSGGLATGLWDLHQRMDGVWVGWSGLAGVTPDVAARVDERLRGLGAAAVPLSADEIDRFYDRYSNAVLWPVLHSQTDLPSPSPADWATYLAVNLKFADAVGRHLRPGDRVWVHDYHLMLVPRLLRARHPHARVGFFLHTPFPEPEALASLPTAQRAALLDGMLGADVVGFHTPAYAARFTDAAQSVLGRGVRHGAVDGGAHRAHVVARPMGIDAAAFEARAADPRVVALTAEMRAPGGPLLVGIDRLDHTKGIPERLEAFGRLLESQPELQGRARLVQLAVPSRERVPAYQALRTRVEAIVARVNGRFGRPGWTPVDYTYGSVDARTLSALYRAADVMLVTPVRDGMNLVAKEFVSSRIDDDGVLVLSDRAGAAEELRAALLVDPTDVASLARAYHAALSMSAGERRVRMRRLRRAVAGHDVFRWAAGLLEALTPAPGAGWPGRLLDGVPERREPA